MLEPYQYKECGLDNVFLHNIKVIADANGEKVISIPKVNKLHKAIASGLIVKNGLLSGKEIRFLRTFLGYTQADFASLLGKDTQTVGRWEREENPQDKTIDILIRTIVKERTDQKDTVSNVDIASKVSKRSKDQNININCENANYTYMKKCA